MGEQRLQRDVEDKWQRDVEDKWQRMVEERWKEKKNRRKEKGWRKRRREERRLPMEERWQRALDRRQRMEEERQQELERWQRMEEEWGQQLEDKRRRSEEVRRQREKERQLPMEEWWPGELERRNRMLEEWQRELGLWHWMEEEWAQRMMYMRRWRIDELRQEDEERWMPMEERRKRKLERLQRMEEERRGELELWQRMEERMEEEKRQRMEEEKRQRMEEERLHELRLMEEEWRPMEEEWRWSKEQRRRLEEERLQRMEERWQQMEQFRRRWDSEADLVRQMEEMAADSADVESIESALVNEDTVQLSLEQELERRREQRQLAVQENLRDKERRLLAGELLLPELDRLAGVEEWREWVEEWPQQMEQFRRRGDSEPNLMRQMEEMAADSADVESIESALVNEDTVQLSLEQELERRREQRQLAVQENLRENERRLLAGELLLPELEREKELDRLAGVEEWREWEEEWRNLQWEQEMEQEGMELESFKPAPAAQEPLLTEDVMGELASTESVVVNEDTEEQQPLIGGMEADSTDVASIIFSDHTEVLFSLEREQEPRQELGSFPQAPGARVDLDWIFVITNFILELASAVFDQLSSVRKPQFALLGMLMSYAALFICIIELVYICRKEKVTWKWRGRLPWLYYPSQKPFGRFDDIIGLVCAICQCVVATIAYSFCLRHADNPIKISIWPIIFASGLLCAKLLRDRRERERERGSTNRLPVSIEDTHYH